MPSNLHTRRISEPFRDATHSTGSIPPGQGGLIPAPVDFGASPIPMELLYQLPFLGLVFAGNETYWDAKGKDIRNVGDIWMITGSFIGFDSGGRIEFNSGPTPDVLSVIDAELHVDTINEYSTDHGVDVEGVNFEDGNITMSSDKWIGLTVDGGRWIFSNKTSPSDDSLYALHANVGIGQESVRSRFSVYYDDIGGDRTLPDASDPILIDQHLFLDGKNYYDESVKGIKTEIVYDVYDDQIFNTIVGHDFTLRTTCINTTAFRITYDQGAEHVSQIETNPILSLVGASNSDPGDTPQHTMGFLDIVTTQNHSSASRGIWIDQNFGEFIDPGDGVWGKCGYAIFVERPYSNNNFFGSHNVSFFGDTVYLGGEFDAGSYKRREDIYLGDVYFGSEDYSGMYYLKMSWEETYGGDATLGLKLFGLSRELNWDIQNFGNMILGYGDTGVDYYLKFNGETSDGILTYMEDESEFRFDQNVGIEKELRLYDGVNYVGLVAPTLAGSQIWELPDADGAAGECIVTDGAGKLGWGISLPSTVGDPYEILYTKDDGSLDWKTRFQGLDQHCWCFG